MVLFYVFCYFIFSKFSNSFGAPCPHTLIFLLQALVKDFAWMIQVFFLMIQLDDQVQHFCDSLLRGLMAAWLQALQGVCKVYSVMLPLFPSPPFSTLLL